MNKLKVLYDAAKVMKSKDAFNGTLTVQVHKDEAQLFSLRNEFAKNLVTGQTKAKISTDLDYAGKTVKHESNTEFTLPHFGECGHHEFLKRLHHSRAAGFGWLKDKLARLTFALSVLAALQIEEQEDKTVVISLNATDLPEDSKALLREKMSRAGACQHHGHGFLKEFCLADDHDFVVNLFLNKNYEVEKIVITFVGTQKDEQNTLHDLTAKAELSLVW